MGREVGSYCNRLVSSYVKYINNQKKYMRKNFEDMDFENADARDEFEAIVENMESKCDVLVSKISSYNFE